MIDSPPGVAIALTFDFDGHTNWITSLGQTTPEPLSRGEFGRVGVRRILNLLSEYGIKATFFTPGANAITFSGLMEAIASGGHEIAHHGWMHEPPVGLEEAAERRALERGIEALETTTGVRPLGYRAPGCATSHNTVRLLLEYGFEYDSSLSGSDFEPYWCRIGDKATSDEPFRFGAPVSLVELPFAWHLDDFIYFTFIPSPALVPGLAAPSTVLEIWQGELDYLCDQVRMGILVLTMHPQVIGRGHRQLMLRSFIEHGLEKQARFVTCLEFAREWSAGREPALPEDCD
jgi:peptidoglycan/xylan/chitin deacetylase (PgdA/CDA1 family)